MVWLFWIFLAITILWPLGIIAYQISKDIFNTGTR